MEFGVLNESSEVFQEFGVLPKYSCAVGNGRPSKAIWALVFREGFGEVCHPKQNICMINIQL